MNKGLKYMLVFIIICCAIFFMPSYFKQSKWKSQTSMIRATVQEENSFGNLGSPKNDPIVNNVSKKKDEAAQVDSKIDRTVHVSKKKDEAAQVDSKFPKSGKSRGDLPELMKNFTIKEISCEKLLRGDRGEQSRALQMANYKGATLSVERFAGIRCESFVRERQYITVPLTTEEENFPIAFSIVVYKDLGQVERLFRAIYRPQNAYCFHADKKAPKEFREGLKRLVNCFPNAIMSSRSLEVHRGWWTSLKSDLICMEDLVKRFPKWKYLINLTGQEFPLRTNLELVRIAKALNGSNNIIPTILSTARERIPKEKSIYPLKWIQSNKHIIAVRGFIEFMFRNEKAIELTNLLRKSPHPETMLFGTLNHNMQLKAPGGSFAFALENRRQRSLTRVKHWRVHQYCSTGRYVRALCIFGVKDLPSLNNEPEMFINKLYWDFQPFALDCLDERIFRNTFEQYVKVKSTMDLREYRNLDSVKYHHP